jgi:hypothetical protein
MSIHEELLEPYKFVLRETITQPLATFRDGSHIVTFFNKEGGTIGVFDFETSPATFTGDVDESAQLFVNAVISAFESRR